MTETKYHDARIIAPYSPDEPHYETPIVFTLGKNATASEWEPSKKIPHVRALFDVLAHHPEAKAKDGLAFVSGEMIPGPRAKTAMKATYALPFDFDRGTDPDAIDAGFLKLGCAFLRYTSFTNGKTRSEFPRDLVCKFLKCSKGDLDSEAMRRYVREKEKWVEEVAATVELIEVKQVSGGFKCFISHAPLHKNRVVVPLAAPFPIDDYENLQAATAAWNALYFGVAGSTGLLEHLDRTGADLNRLFYFPRHPKGGSHDTVIAGGPLLDWKALDFSNPLADEAERIGGDKTSKSNTPEGRALGKWWIAYGNRCQIADLLRNETDKVRGPASAGVTIECPFDEEHSNAGEANDPGCFAVDAGDGRDSAFVRCQHNSCRDYTTLDHVGKMIADKWFTRETLESDNYNALPDDAPQPEIADDIVRAAINALNEESTLADVEKVIAVIVDSEIPEGKVLVALAAILELTGGRKSAFQRKALNALLAEARIAKNEEKESAPDTDNDGLKDALSKSLGREFTFPPRHLGRFLLKKVGGKIWLCQSGDEAARIATPFLLTGGVVYADRGNARALRVEVLNQDSKWVSVEIDAGDLATQTGVDALRKLMSAGLAPTQYGKDFVTAYLTESQPSGPTVYDIAGFHGDAFVCPTGEVLLTKSLIELAKEKRLKCEAQAGSYDDWRSAIAGVFALPMEDAFLFHTGFLMGWAGTLANLADDETLMYDLGGETTTGKTTAGACAVANWCKPDLKGGKGLMMSGKGTDNSQEAVFEKGTGTVAVLDEIGQLAAKLQSDIVFMGQSGAGKRRFTPNAEEKRTRGWKGGCVIFSSEKGMAARLRQEGIKAANGLFARVLPISTDGVKRLEPGQFQHIESAIKNYGWSGPEFVRGLHRLGHVKNRDGLKDKIVGLIDSLENTQGAENAYRRRAARLVAYIWAAGWIAQDIGLIPENYEVEALAKKLWGDALQSDSGPTDPNQRAWETLVDNIISRKDVDIVAMKMTDDERRYREPVGFYDDVEGRYIIRASKFDELCGNTVSGRAFRKYLEEKGVLIREKKEGDSRTWRTYPGLGKDATYVVLDMAKIDG